MQDSSDFQILMSPSFGVASASTPGFLEPYLVQHAMQERRQ